MLHELRGFRLDVRSLWQARPWHEGQSVARQDVRKQTVSTPAALQHSTARHGAARTRPVHVEHVSSARLAGEERDGLPRAQQRAQQVGAHHL